MTNAFHSSIHRINVYPIYARTDMAQLSGRFSDRYTKGDVLQSPLDRD